MIEVSETDEVEVTTATEVPLWFGPQLVIPRIREIAKTNAVLRKLNITLLIQSKCNTSISIAHNQYSARQRPTNQPRLRLE